MSKHEEPMKTDSVSVSPADSEKISFEETRIDDTLMDTTETIKTTCDELAERSKFRDKKILEKERKRDEEEQKYNEIKRKREEDSDRKRKKTSSKKKKKKKISSPPNPSNEQINLPPNIRPVPENVKNLENLMMLCSVLTLMGLLDSTLLLVTFLKIQIKVQSCEESSTDTCVIAGKTTKINTAFHIHDK